MRNPEVAGSDPAFATFLKKGELGVNMIEAIIYDLDGTLVYFKQEGYSWLVIQALKEFNVIPTQQQIDKFWYMGNRDNTILEFWDIDPPEFWNAYSGFDTIEHRMNYVGPYSDAAVVKMLSKAQKKQGIVTAAPKDIGHYQIELIGHKYFGSIVNANVSSGIPKKPAPDGILKCLKELKIRPENAVMVGNGPEDYSGAISAGVKPIWLDRQEYDYPNFNPEIKIESLIELLDIEKWT